MAEHSTEHPYSYRQGNYWADHGSAPHRIRLVLVNAPHFNRSEQPGWFGTLEYTKRYAPIWNSLLGERGLPVVLSGVWAKWVARDRGRSTRWRQLENRTWI